MVVFKIIGILLAVLFVMAAFYLVFESILRRKEAKIILKSVVKQINKSATIFSFTILFFSLLVAIVFGNNIAMSNYYSQINNIYNNSLHNQLVIRNPYNLTNKSNQWAELEQYVDTNDPNYNQTTGKITYNDIFIDNSCLYFDTDFRPSRANNCNDANGDTNGNSIYYLNVLLNQLNKNSELIFSLNSLINLTYTLDPINDIPNQDSDILEYEIQVVRVPDYSATNSLIFKDKQYILNSFLPDSEDNLNYQVGATNLINDNQAVLIHNEDEIPLGSQLHLFSQIDAYRRPSDADKKFQPLNVEPLEIVNYAYSTKYLSPSASIASSPIINPLVSTSDDIAKTAIVFVNETTFNSIFEAYITLYEQAYIDNTLPGPGRYTNTVAGGIYLMLEEENLALNFALGDVKTYEKILSGNSFIETLANDVSNLEFFINTEIAKYFNDTDSNDLSNRGATITPNINEVYANQVAYEWYNEDLQLNRNTTKGFVNYNSYQSISFSITIAIFLISAIVIFIILVRQIKRNQKELGVLKSIGFHTSAISIGYSVFPTLALIPGLFIGFIFSTPVILWWNSLFATGAFINYSQATSSIAFYVLSSLVILVVYIVFSFIVSQIYLRKKSLVLVNEVSNSKASFWVRKIDKLSLNTKNRKSSFGSLHLIKNSFNSTKTVLFNFVIILGMTILLMFTFSAQKAVETSVEKSFQPVQFDQFSILNTGSDGLLSAPGVNKKYVTNQDFEEKKEIYNIVTASVNEDVTNLNNYCSFAQSTLNNMTDPLDLYSAIPVDQVVTFLDMTASFATYHSNDVNNTLLENINNLQASCNLNLPSSGNISSASLNSDFLSKLYSELNNLVYRSENANSLEYISFYLNTYEPSNQNLASVSISNVYFDRNNDCKIDLSEQDETINNEFGKTLPTLFADTTTIADFIYFESLTSSIDTIDYYLSDINNLTQDFNCQGPNGTETVAATKVVIDSLTAANQNIKPGDLIYVEINSKFTPPADVSGSDINDLVFPVIVQDIGFSPVPFGLVIPKDAPDVIALQNKVIDDISYSFNSLNGNLVTKDTNGQQGITQSLSTPYFYDDNVTNKLPQSIGANQSYTSLFDFLNSTTGVSSYVGGSERLVFPISIAEDQVEKNIASITSITTILFLLTLISALILLSLVISQVIEENKKQSTVLQALGYKPRSVANLTLTGYLIQFLLFFAISIPIGFAFISLVNSLTSLAVVGVFFLSVSSLQIIFVLLILVGTYLISWLIAYLIYSNQKPASALKNNLV